MRNMTEVVGNIIKDLEESTSGLDNLKMVTDEINKKCEHGLSDLSKNLERQTNDLRSSSTGKAGKFTYYLNSVDVNKFNKQIG
jgi:predicted  nucleic acid-binding Zn ribbon protein